MYTVGLINKYECAKTYSYEDLEKAKYELKHWKDCFLNNNVVENFTTIVERDKCCRIIGIKHIFRISSNDEYIMFLCKNK